MAMDLRPLSLGELLDRAFTLYRRNLWLFVGIMAVPSAIGLMFNLAVETFNRRTGGNLEQALANPEEGAVIMATLVAGMLLGLVAYFAVYAVALGAMTLAVSELYQGRTTTIGAVYRQMRPRLGSLVWLMFGMGIRLGLLLVAWITLVTVLSVALALVTSPILMGFVMAAGMVAGFAVCFFILLRWGVAIPALVLEGHGARGALSRSIALTRGRLGRVFLLVVCATLITYAALMLFQGPFWLAAALAGPETTSAFWLMLAGTVSGTVGATITGPIMIVGLALLYYDARVREEGLDLQLMMAAIDGTPAAPLARG